MEITCTRCHQAVQPGDCYCPVCGLPQLVYSGENSTDQSQPDKWNEAVRDAGTIDWKPALRYALLLAVPAGVLSSMLASIGLLGLLLMAVTGALVVVLYMRNRRPSWITLGAGARLGLVTGVLGGWTTAASSGFALYAARYWFHQGNLLDDLLQKQIGEGSQQMLSLGFDAATVATTRALMLSPEGRAGSVLFNACFLALAILVFAVAGAALSARILARTRRPQN
jgi:fluoride ion exporter CrcB/FEX